MSRNTKAAPVRDLPGNLLGEDVPLAGVLAEDRDDHALARLQAEARGAIDDAEGADERPQNNGREKGCGGVIRASCEFAVGADAGLKSSEGRVRRDSVLRAGSWASLGYSRRDGEEEARAVDALGVRVGIEVEGVETIICPSG